MLEKIKAIVNRPKVRNTWQKITYTEKANLGSSERLTSLMSGGLTLAGGLRRPRSWRGIAAMVTGGYLLYRGLSGHCPFYQVIGRSTLTDTERQQLKANNGSGNGTLIRSNHTIDRKGKVDEEVSEAFLASSDLPVTY